MAIRIVRLGTARARNEGLRIGTVRRPPRGVPKADYGKCDYFDVWLPELAPSALVISRALAEPWMPARWRQFSRSYRREMRDPRARHLIVTLAALSHQTNFSVGCYCADAAHCHRTLLRELLAEAGAVLIGENSPGKEKGGRSAQNRAIRYR